LVFGCFEDPDSDSDSSTGDVAGGVPGAFNYIPLNEDVCQVLQTPEHQQAAKEQLAKLAGATNSWVVSEWELCSPEKNTNGCSPCDSNPMLSLLNEVDTLLAGSKDFPAGSMADYFREALRYPFRDLAISRVKGEDGDDLAPWQARKLPCAEGKCPRYEAQADSLISTCDGFTLAMAVDEASGSEITTDSADLPFGFYVPLLDELPKLGSKSDEELIEWVNDHQHLRIKVEDPWLGLNTKDGESGCGTINGYLRVADIQQMFGDVVDANKYADKLFPDKVAVVISVKLNEVTKEQIVLPKWAQGGAK